MPADKPEPPPIASRHGFAVKPSFGIYYAPVGQQIELGTAAELQLLYRQTLKVGSRGVRHGFYAGFGLAIYPSRSIFSRQWQPSISAGYHAEGIYRSKRGSFRIDWQGGAKIGLAQLGIGLSNSVAFLFKVQRSYLGWSVDLELGARQTKVAGLPQAYSPYSIAGLSLVFLFRGVESKGTLPASGLE